MKRTKCKPNQNNKRHHIKRSIPSNQKHLKKATMKENKATKQLDGIKHPRKHGKAKQIEKYTKTQNNLENNNNELN